MINAVLSSLTTLKFAVAVLVVIISIMLVRGLLWMTRLGRPRSDRRTFSDLPELVHGPQELHRSSDEARVSRGDR